MANDHAETITRQSRSNLALSFVALRPEQRRDITTFYAFCRVIDDIADEPSIPLPEKTARLAAWRASLETEQPNESSLEPAMRALLAKYGMSPAMPGEIISGVEMDLAISRYATFEELRLYCYRVASAVGLVSIEIFGYRDPACREYAIELGLALQLTNIIRDVATDLKNDRIYLPLEDLARFGYSEADLRNHVYDERFRRLMEFEAERAEQYYARATSLLPKTDRRSMVAAEIMHAVYHALLKKMRADRFRVFEKEYRVSKPVKLWHVVWQLLKNR